MPISRLPEETARELGSTLAVSSPIAVVKELLDNALDAGASYVDVIVSIDTLDRIEVRDNGHGISTDDLDALGRSGYTSKITTFEDVITLGGKSLGFRGVALASINAVAEVTLTTRTATDKVATQVQLLPGGGVARKQHISAPVGTTVYASKLFSRTPVRERVAFKDAKKNIITMKELLQGYALARPHVKLHFRVVSGDQTLPWSYSPKPPGAIRDTIVQLFGTELGSSCAERTFCSDQSREPSSTSEDPDGKSSNSTGRQDNLRFEAYLPHSFADAIRVSRRAFFSVDSRPVQAKRGTLKKLYDIFKMHLSRAMSSSGQTEVSRTPFIRLNIRCEPRSYDVNLEPSKDDVLFHDEGYVIGEFEKFMLSVYPITPGSPGTQPEAAALLSPSSAPPQQSNVHSSTSGPFKNSQGSPISVQPAPLNSNAANLCYPSPGANRPEISGRTAGSRPAIQAPYTPTQSQLSFTPINPECAQQNRRLDAYLTPPAFPGRGDPQHIVGELRQLKIALPIRQPGSEQRLSNTPSAIITAPTHTGRLSAVATGNLTPTEGPRIIPGENVGSVQYDVHQPRGQPGPGHLRPGLDHVLPTPIMHTGASQSRPDIRSQLVSADMSACFVDSDDEEAMPRNSVPRPKLPPAARDRRRGLDEVEEPRGNPLEGLNPWSIAKLTASRKRPPQPPPQPVRERDSEEFGEMARPSQPRARGPLQPHQFHNSRFTGQYHKPLSKVPGGAYKRPTMNEARARGKTDPMVQTTLSRFRAPGHPGYAHMGAEGAPRDSVTRTARPEDAASSPARLPKWDPRSYLLNDQQQPAADPAQRKLRRCKTDLLPLEKTPLGSETHALRLTLNVKTEDLANLLEMVSGLDSYNRDGKVARGLHDNITPDDLLRLVARAKNMLGV